MASEQGFFKSSAQVIFRSYSRGRSLSVVSSHWFGSSSEVHVATGQENAPTPSVAWSIVGGEASPKGVKRIRNSLGIFPVTFPHEDRARVRNAGSRKKVETVGDLPERVGIAKSECDVGFVGQRRGEPESGNFRFGGLRLQQRESLLQGEVGEASQAPVWAPWWRQAACRSKATKTP
jgi:hypothetical protein